MSPCYTWGKLKQIHEQNVCFIGIKWQRQLPNQLEFSQGSWKPGKARCEQQSTVADVVPGSLAFPSCQSTSSPAPLTVNFSIAGSAPWVFGIPLCVCYCVNLFATLLCVFHCLHCWFGFFTFDKDIFLNYLQLLGSSLNLLLMCNDVII